ncbi:hypothetical protein CR51_27275 [Caballeronia megalochromosomata]|nr:hypothetical protein CR51_27275 [Caballeronia megalochromosomata]
MRQGVSLKGDRNQCGECGELFNSVYAFDKHRIGTVGVHEGPAARRCMSLIEMRFYGMAKNNFGFWVTDRMSVEDIQQKNSVIAARDSTLETTAGRCR